MRKHHLPLSLVLAFIASCSLAANFYWDGPELKTWEAVDNGGLSWWRTDATNGAFSATLPGNDDVCYDLRTNMTLRPTIDLGSAGHFAVLHLGNGANWGYAASTGNNPVVVDAGTANCGTASGNAVWQGPVTLNGNLRVVKSQSTSSVQLCGSITGPGGMTFANVGPAYLYNASNDFGGGMSISSNAGVYAASCGCGPISIARGAFLRLNVDRDWVLTNAISGFGTNLVWSGTRTLTLSGTTITTGTTAAPGKLTVAGNLIFSNTTLSAVLGGSTNNGLLAVLGTAAISRATLDVSFANGFVPGPADVFTVFSSTGAAQGSFANDSHGIVTFSNGWQANVSYATASGGTTVTLANMMRTTCGSGFRLR